MSNVNMESIRSAVEDIAKSCGIQYPKIDFKEETNNGNNYLSNIVRIQIDDEENEENNLNLLMKVNNVNEQNRKRLPVEILFRREANAYENVLPELCEYQIKHNVSIEDQYRHAKMFKANLEYLNEYLILEDLSPLGYKMYAKNIPADLERAILVLRIIAKFHGVSFAMKKLNAPRFSEIVQKIPSKQNYVSDLPLLIRITDKIIPHMDDENHRAIIKEVISNRMSILSYCLDSDLTEPYNVICHGDLWNNNALFKTTQDGTREVILVDYQFLRYSSPATDFIYYLYQTSTAFRRHYFNRLCDEYYDSLGEHLKYYGCDIDELYPRQIFYKHLGHCTPVGIILGFLSCKPELNGIEMELGDLAKVADGANITAAEILERSKGYAEDAIKYRNNISHILNKK